MRELEGIVDNIIYRSEETGYTVFELAVKGQSKPVTCVGGFSFISEGVNLLITGRDKHHPVYGDQIEVVSYTEREPQDAAAMERYLASDAIKGVGKKMAARIVERFGDDTFRIIEEEPEALVDIKGISERIAREISEQFEQQREIRQSMMFLQKYGINGNLASKIFKQYGKEASNIITRNPYKLAEDIKGIGFKTADELAMRVGIDTNSVYRIRAGIIYELSLSEVGGHTYLPEDRLIEATGQLLAANREEIERQLDKLIVDGEVIAKQRDYVANTVVPTSPDTFTSSTPKGAAVASSTLNDAAIASSTPKDAALAATTSDGATLAEHIMPPRCIYRSVFYYMELNVARMLHDLNVKYKIDIDKLEKQIKKIETRTGITLDELQRTAVVEAARNGLFIMTGGPGTGKTTTIKAMISFFEQEGCDILLAAPTGRAAKRMSETTDREAVTIHRLLGYQGMPDDSIDSGRYSFDRNEDNPLEADVIIIDEMSMVDISLMNALLKAISVGTRLIMVGDVNQLPSVGPGNVLKDIINSKRFTFVMLTRIFRQALESDIVVNAHKINHGEELTLDNKSKDFFFMERATAEEIQGIVVALVRDKLAGYVGAQPFDIQVLSPMKKGELGVFRLNTILQHFLNPPEKGKKEKEFRDCIFREGDKVMQIKNNYQTEWEIRNKKGFLIESGTGVFNGDCGRIIEINSFAECMEIEFDEGRRVTYPFSQLEELELAYAVTIHKSQGSEYPAVVIPLLSGPPQLFNRNILYTAVTRARKCVTIVGSRDMVTTMIHNENEQKRYSGLSECIKEII